MEIALKKSKKMNLYVFKLLTHDKRINTETVMRIFKNVIVAKQVKILNIHKFTYCNIGEIVLQ